MAVIVRPLRDDEIRLYLEIHERAEVVLPNDHRMAAVAMAKDL